MTRLFKLQFLGPLTLFTATLSAEVAARALEYAPASETLWYLNLKVFSLFQKSHFALSEFADVEGFQLFAIALPIFALACVGLIVRSRLPLAISTQLAVAYAVYLVRAWQPPMPRTEQASLTSFAVPTGEGLYMLSAVLGACLLSFLVTHWLYLQKSRAHTSA
jgi:hypothetical protein